MVDARIACWQSSWHFSVLVIELLLIVINNIQGFMSSTGDWQLMITRQGNLHLVCNSYLSLLVCCKPKTSIGD